MLCVGHHGIQVRWFSPVLYALWQDRNQANAQGCRSTSRRVGSDEEGDGPRRQCPHISGQSYSLLLGRWSPKSARGTGLQRVLPVSSVSSFLLRQHEVILTFCKPVDYNTTNSFSSFVTSSVAGLQFTSLTASLSLNRHLWAINSASTTIRKFIAECIITIILSFYEDTTVELKSVGAARLRLKGLLPGPSSSSLTRSYASTIE